MASVTLMRVFGAIVCVQGAAAFAGQHAFLRPQLSTPGNSDRSLASRGLPQVSLGPQLGRSESSVQLAPVGQPLETDASAIPKHFGLTQPQVKTCLAVASIFALGVGLTLMRPSAAWAEAVATKAVEPSLHLGQKVARKAQSYGLPDEAVLMLISALPVVELRGGVPVGVWMGMPIAKTLALCVAGNMVPIPLILLALRSQFVQRLAKPVLKRARRKAETLGDAGSQALALTLFVGIPLPGTGAWTGAMIASLLDMPVQKAMLSILGGVISAGLIMAVLTLSGKVGGLVACGVLAAFCVSTILKKGRGGKELPK